MLKFGKWGALRGRLGGSTLDCGPAVGSAGRAKNKTTQYEFEGVEGGP